MKTSPEFLCHPVDPDIASIPSTVPDFRKELEHISDADLAFLSNPRESDEDEQLWLRYHNLLNHLDRDDMFRICQTGVIPKRVQRV